MSFVKKIVRTPLFRITSLNGLSVIIKIAIGVLTSKVLAIFVGPAGMALVGNLRNFVTSAEGMATLGFQNGIVKYVAEKRDEPEALRKIIATAFISLLSAAIFLSVLLLVFADYFNTMVFGSNFSLHFVFTAMALALPWFAVSLLLIAIINGLGQYRRVIHINIAGNVIGLIGTVLLIWHYQTEGALLAIVITPALLFFVSFYLIQKQIRFSQYIAPRHFDVEVVRNLSSYSLMALASAVIGPLVYLAIRNKLIMVSGIEAAGYWEAMTRISTYYLMFVSTILGVYYLPKLALAKNDKETRLVFANYFRGIMPILIAGLVLIYFARDIIIQILFTANFEPVRELFFWQLLGDIFKAASMILGYQFFAARLTTAFIVTEIFSLAVLYVASIFLIAVAGVEGVVMAHAITYFIYLIVLMIYFRKKLFG